MGGGKKGRGRTRIRRLFVRTSSSPRPSHLVFGALVRVARLRSRRIPFAVAESAVRGQRNGLFGRRAQRLRVLVVPVVVELLVLVVVFRVAHRSLSAVRFAAVFAGAAALAIAVRGAVVLSGVRVDGACETGEN